MSKVKLLDCTLRDGGYCNQWNFGHANIKKIISSLQNANVDIVECGFITNTVTHNDDISKFNNVEQLKSVISTNKQGTKFVAMINYGEFDVSILPQCSDTLLDGIRVAFHKKDMRDAMALCKVIKEKGYEVFVQPMVTPSYSDEEFLSLIAEANALDPYVFYIVDSFGMIKSRDLMRWFYLVEHNLKSNIRIGFHSHNNMQLAYSNAQQLILNNVSRKIIIDSSIYGMGRGAGNLATELIMEYINENLNTNYNIQPLLLVIDEVLDDFYKQNAWGYSLPNYLSAKHCVHPNYSIYLAEKCSLTVSAMDEIISLISEDKKFEYDKDYIAQLYVSYQSAVSIQSNNIVNLTEQLNTKTVLLIAPGESSLAESDVIEQFLQHHDVIAISINYDDSRCKYIFSSNLRRFRELQLQSYHKCIATSNIHSKNVFARINYFDLLYPNEVIKDNAGIMAIQFLIKLGVTKIYLAGFDGYSHNMDKNYALNNMRLFQRESLLDAINIAMTQALAELSRQIQIEFLTTEKHIHIKHKGDNNMTQANNCRGGLHYKQNVSVCFSLHQLDLEAVA